MSEGLGFNEFYDYTAPNTTGTPERNLLTAILERAILDYTGNDPEESAKAEEWIFGDLDDPDHEPYTFAWLCNQLDLSIKTTASKIKRMPQRGNSRVAPWYMQRNATDQLAANSR